VPACVLDDTIRRFQEETTKTQGQLNISFENGMVEALPKERNVNLLELPKRLVLSQSYSNVLRAFRTNFTPTQTIHRNTQADKILEKLQNSSLLPLFSLNCSCTSITEMKVMRNSLVPDAHLRQTESKRTDVVHHHFIVKTNFTFWNPTGSRGTEHCFRTDGFI